MAGYYRCVRLSSRTKRGREIMASTGREVGNEALAANLGFRSRFCIASSEFQTWAIPRRVTPRFAQAPFHGLMTGTPVRAKSATFRVTMERRWRNAVAAIKASTAGKVEVISALSRPHSSATDASTGNTLPANQAGSSISNHVPIRSRRRPEGSFSTPLRISPSVNALTKRASETVASNHSTTCGAGFGFVNSDKAQVSTR